MNLRGGFACGVSSDFPVNITVTQLSQTFIDVILHVHYNYGSPLVAGFMTIFGLSAKDLRATSSLLVMLNVGFTLTLDFRISVVFTLMYVSSVGDFAVGGVYPVGVQKVSTVVLEESVNQCCSLRRLLNNKVSQFTRRSFPLRD